MYTGGQEYLYRPYAIPHVTKHETDSGWKFGYYAAILCGKEDRGIGTWVQQSTLRAHSVNKVYIDQLRRERLSHEYHYPPFWWSKLPVVIVRCVVDNEAIDIEMHWEPILFSFARCAHCLHTVLHFWPPVILTTKMAGNDIHEINVRTTTGLYR